MVWRKRTWLKLTLNWFLWAWGTQMPFGCSTGRNPPNVMYVFRHCFGFPNITHRLGWLENIWRLPHCSLWGSRQALVGHRRLFNNRWPQWYSRRPLEEYGQAVGIFSRFLTQELTCFQRFTEIFNRKYCSASTTARLLRSNGGSFELSWKVCNNVLTMVNLCNPPPAKIWSYLWKKLPCSLYFTLMHKTSTILVQSLRKLHTSYGIHHSD